jgi:hypothetical protein
MSIDAMKQVLAVMDTVAPSVEASAPRYYAAREALRAAIELAQPERIQLTVRDFVVTVGGIEDAVGTPMYWAEWPNKEQP